jgi:hypothetical protein
VGNPRLSANSSCRQSVFLSPFATASSPAFNPLTCPLHPEYLLACAARCRQPIHPLKLALQAMNLLANMEISQIIGQHFSAVPNSLSLRSSLESSLRAFQIESAYLTGNQHISPALFSKALKMNLDTTCDSVHCFSCKMRKCAHLKRRTLPNLTSTLTSRTILSRLS